jgi:hypothetical protein
MMDVRICGPNLRYQHKGTFHVHQDGCNDLKTYGPGLPQGGDTLGIMEMLVTDATICKVVEAVYDNGIIDEHLADGDDHEEVINNLVGDFWFAPCCNPADHEGFDFGTPTPRSIEHFEGDHQVSGPLETEWSPENFELLSWEDGDNPDPDDLDRILSQGYTVCRYVDWDSDMHNLLCSKSTNIKELEQDKADELGRAVFEHLTS